MPSKATKKPTGPCSACQKQGALLRCVPCRDAGVDIFFCNRECQAKLWKQHKAFCGKVLTTSPNLENIQNRKDAKVVQKAFRAHNRHSASCQNCSKNGTEVGHELSLCSKCKRAAYCSRECQVAHWPNHREFCRQRCAELKKWGQSLSSKDKNIRSLLDDWRMLSTSIMGNAMEFCLTEEEVKQQPPTKMIWVHIQFNYNLRTFMLVQEPQALKISELRQAEQDRVRDSYKRNIQMLRGKSDRAFIQFLFLSCRDLEKGFLSLDPLIFYGYTGLSTAIA
ncbi:hypothetical protein CTEN210_08823 [Chaetoceros tenuissimus]|uniref:MYND-type domain-containing protein n=1 Tax=Chaetoceros tenuissimus TaxID=426638 RepID=A0AAD3CU97_9STRA|nr:hypothetical protein CTEN210_08823 [Chaetoceros tenuissimus]